MSRVRKAHWEEDHVFFCRPHTAPVDTGRSASSAWLSPASFHALYLQQQMLAEPLTQYVDAICAASLDGCAAQCLRAQIH